MVTIKSTQKTYLSNITKIGKNQRIFADESANTWKLQWYDSNAGAWVDIMSYSTVDQAINMNPLVLKNVPLITLKGTETDAIESQLKENAGGVSIEDISNSATLMKLLANIPLEFDVAVPVIFESAQTGLAADATGVKFTSESVIPALMHYAKSAAIEATWDADNTDSETTIELYDASVSGGAVIASVSGNVGTDDKSTYGAITEGNKLVVRINITKASGTTGAKTGCSKAVVYFRVSLA